MKLLTILAIVAAALALAGCDPAPKSDEPTNSTNSPANSASATSAAPVKATPETTTTK